MSVYRVGEMQAKDEATEKLREFLISIMSGIKSSEGCQGVRLYQSQEDTNKFMMIETWDSVKSHQTSVKNISPKQLGEVRLLLATSPSGSYYNLIEEK